MLPYFNTSGPCIPGEHYMLPPEVNGGGRIEREYGLGRHALDLMIEWRGQRHAIEVEHRGRRVHVVGC